jgi:hypothetical protein
VGRGGAALSAAASWRGGGGGGGGPADAGWPRPPLPLPLPLPRPAAGAGRSFCLPDGGGSAAACTRAGGVPSAPGNRCWGGAASWPSAREPGRGPGGGGAGLGAALRPGSGPGGGGACARAASGGAGVTPSRGLGAAPTGWAAGVGSSAASFTWAGRGGVPRGAGTQRWLAAGQGSRVGGAQGPGRRHGSQASGCAPAGAAAPPLPCAGSPPAPGSSAAAAAQRGWRGWHGPTGARPAAAHCRPLVQAALHPPPTRRPPSARHLMRVAAIPYRMTPHLYCLLQRQIFLVRAVLRQAHAPGSRLARQRRLAATGPRRGSQRGGGGAPRPRQCALRQNQQRGERGRGGPGKLCSRMLSWQQLRPGLTHQGQAEARKALLRAAATPHSPPPEAPLPAWWALAWRGGRQRGRGVAPPWLHPPAAAARAAAGRGSSLRAGGTPRGRRRAPAAQRAQRAQQARGALRGRLTPRWRCVGG